jgi:hypothetical protein
VLLEAPWCNQRAANKRGVDCITRIQSDGKTREVYMKKSPTIIKLELRNAVIRLKRGVIDLDQFRLEAPGRLNACSLSNVFFEWEEVKSFLHEHGFPEDYFEEMQEIWEEGFLASA